MNSPTKIPPPKSMTKYKATKATIHLSRIILTLKVLVIVFP